MGRCSFMTAPWPQWNHRNRFHGLLLAHLIHSSSHRPNQFYDSCKRVVRHCILFAITSEPLSVALHPMSATIDPPSLFPILATLAVGAIVLTQKSCVCVKSKRPCLSCIPGKQGKCSNSTQWHCPAQYIHSLQGSASSAYDRLPLTSPIVCSSTSHTSLESSLESVQDSIPLPMVSAPVSLP